MVGAEDGRQAIDDYDLHMRMIGYFSRLYPQVAIALHAGELVLGLVPPAELRDHIRKAIDLTPVRRIGHGVDVMYEDDPFGLLAEMARRKVMVEINLTSNDLILSVRGREHPLGTYLRAGVPAALSTDDEGIERIDLTHEYQIAVEEHGLSYRDLKRMSRNALEYSFLPGPSLWAEPDRVNAVAICRPMTAPACATWVAASPKAQAQLTLEQRFTAFETQAWPPIDHRKRR
jgi:adenosine deaminase